MKKKCLSCGVQFHLSGSGKRQKYCSNCRKRGMGKGWGLSVSKHLKTKGAEKHFWTPIPPGPNTSPIEFTTPEGDKGRIWTWQPRNQVKGEEIFWRSAIAELKRLGEKRCGFSEPRKATSDIIQVEGSSHVPLTRLKPNAPARDPNVLPDIWPRPWGYKVNVYIEAEKELQELGCGWRTVIVEFDGSKVHVHHNGRRATMKRAAFKEFIAANKRYRKRAHRRKPNLTLVVNNPTPKPERHERPGARREGSSRDGAWFARIRTYSRALRR
jgi:hypothetical protein